MKRPKKNYKENDKGILDVFKVKINKKLKKQIYDLSLKIESIEENMQEVEKEVESIKDDLQTEKIKIAANISNISEINNNLKENKDTFEVIGQHTDISGEEKDTFYKEEKSTVTSLDDDIIVPTKPIKEEVVIEGGIIKGDVVEEDDIEEDDLEEISPISLSFQQKVDEKVNKLKSYLYKGGLNDLLISREWKDFFKSTKGLGTRKNLKVNEANDVALLYRKLYKKLLERNPNDEETFTTFKQTVQDLNLFLDIKIGEFPALGSFNDPENNFEKQYFENIKHVKSKKHIVDAINKKIEDEGEKLRDYKGRVVYLTRPTIVIGDHLFEGEVIVI
jgi:hypothetical protein